MKHIEILQELQACKDAVEWAKDYESLEEAWNECQRGDWMLCLDRKLNLFTESDRRLMGCRFVRETPIGDGRAVWDLLTDERSRNAIEVAERYAEGKATDEDLNNAADYAYAAGAGAGAAGYAAYAAYAAAAYAAGAGAGAYAAAYAAARAAWDAAGDAWAAAGDAAEDAAGDAWAAAARAAAWAAAGDAWAAAARAAARKQQSDIIRTFGNPFKGNEVK